MCLGLLVVGYANTTRAYIRNNSHGCQHHHSYSPFSSKCQTHTSAHFLHRTHVSRDADPNHLENNVFVVTALCKRLKMSNIPFLIALFAASLEVSTFRYLAQSTNNGTLGSFPNITPTSLVLLQSTCTCAFKPGCLMSHN